MMLTADSKLIGTKKQRLKSFGLHACLRLNPASRPGALPPTQSGFPASARSLAESLSEAFVSWGFELARGRPSVGADVSINPRLL